MIASMKNQSSTSFGAKLKSSERNYTIQNNGISPSILNFPFQKSIFRFPCPYDFRKMGEQTNAAKRDAKELVSE